MRKKLDTRFPASRIKKIMQTDEDVGKIAMAVPLLVSKALELFLQDLCDRTYEITLNRGAKTMNSLHLKQCVHSYNVFDFLKDTVSKVPDLGGSDAVSEDRPTIKRRKVVTDGEENGSDEELKKIKVVPKAPIVLPQHDVNPSTVVVKRGRGRPRGRGRGSRTQERDLIRHQEKCEEDPDISKLNDNDNDPFLESPNDGLKPERPEENLSGDGIAGAPIRNFDLNIDLNENLDPTTTASATAACSPEPKHEEYPGWSAEEMERIAIDPGQLVTLNKRVEEEDEDYDEEG